MATSFRSSKDGATKPDSSTDALARQLTRTGFAFVTAARMKALLDVPSALADWRDFADSWNDLAPDNYLPDGHRYRRRRHATLSVGLGEATPRLEPHRPHFQNLEYNPLVGGIERWFEPMRADIIGGATMRSVLAFACQLFGSLRPHTGWLIECHQFRIEARNDAPGLPTPEGVHRDGVDYVLVLLVARSNIAQGTTTMHDLHDLPLGSFTLAKPFDTALVDDVRVKHGVTPVQAVDPGLPAYRDVLVVTLRAHSPES